MGSDKQLKANSHADPASKACAQQPSGSNAFLQQKAKISVSHLVQFFHSLCVLYTVD